MGSKLLEQYEIQIASWPNLQYLLLVNTHCQELTLVGPLPQTYLMLSSAS